MLKFFKSITKKSNGNSDKDDPSSRSNLNLPKHLSPDLVNIIENVVCISDTTVKEIMVPRIDVVVIKSDQNINEIIKIIVETGHSRIPIFEKSVDNIIGILYVKDLLRALPFESDFNVKDIIRPALFVPESKKIETMFKEFKEKNTHITIVVDEYGGFAGIVTLEDILEEIVGDIQDEFDNEEDELVELEHGKYLVDTRMDLEDLCDRIGIRLPTEKADTLGGYVFNLFGKIPSRNEQITNNNITFSIEKVNGNRIEKILISIPNELSNNDEK